MKKKKSKKKKIFLIFQKLGFVLEMVEHVQVDSWARTN